MIKTLILLVGVLTFTGCQSIPTTRPVYQPPSPRDAVALAQRSLNEGKVFDAVAWWLRSEGAETRPTETVVAIRRRLQELLEEHLGGQRYAEALAVTQAMRALAPEGDLPPPRQLYLLMADHHRSQGRAPVAMDWVLRAAEIAPLEPEEAADWAQWMYQEGNRGALEHWARLHPALRLEPPIREWLQRAGTAADWLEGTVTVVVNRGIRIERGVGVPDIMVGSGFYIDRAGHLLTNYHVIRSEVDPEYKGFSRLHVIPTGSRGERLPARVVGWDENLDIALVKVERRAPYVFSLIDRPRVRQGDRVFVLGSPVGLEATVTAGVISSLRRNFLPAGSALQVDAPVNPGNSGGPLLTQDGQLIGVIFAGAPNFEGLNFAIDAEYIAPILERLYAGSAVIRAWLGFGIHLGPATMEVNYLYPLGPAEEAGLPLGAQLKSIQGQPVDDPADVHRILASVLPGSLVVLGWEKEGNTGLSYVVSRPRPKNPLVAAIQTDSAESLFPHLIGAWIEPVDRFWQNYRVSRVLPNSVADQLSLSEHDWLGLREWRLDPKAEALSVVLQTKRRQAGYLESSVGFVLNLFPSLQF